MENEEKAVFLFGNKYSAEKLSELLRNKKINNTVDCSYAGYVIYVPAEKYLESIEVGTELLEQLNLEGTLLSFYAEVKPVGYIPLGYFKLPINRRGDETWSIVNPEVYGLDKEYCPIDIKEYVKQLKEWTLRDVIIHCRNNVIEISLKGKISEYEKLLSNFKLSNEEIKQTSAKDKRHHPYPFVEEMYFAKTGELIQEEIKEKTPRKNLHSYLYGSLFYEGLVAPYGNNIAPKLEEKDSTEITGYKSNYSSNRVQFVAEDIPGRDEDIGFKDRYYQEVQGRYRLETVKNYTYYWDALNKKQHNMNEKEKFIMLDIGDFKTTVEVLCPLEVVVNTKVEVVRSVYGHNYDGETIRDPYFGVSIHANTRFAMEIKEYFRRLGNNRLLHYSDNSDQIEIFAVDGDWELYDGIDSTTLDYPAVYDSVEALKDDPDYTRIKERLDARKNDKVYVKVI